MAPRTIKAAAGKTGKITVKAATAAAKAIKKANVPKTAKKVAR